jgi:NAD-dependent deacetylase
MTADSDLDQVAAWLQAARRVLFITGAGVSADSGLPTYRGIGGLYRSGATEEGIAIEEALSRELFARRPDVTWKYLRQIEAACRDAAHNRAHEVMALLERGRREVWVFTQNVDGLHHAAGSRHVIDIHGDVHDIICTGCDFAEWVESFSGFEPTPRCPRCGAVLRPNVVLFGENLPVDKLDLFRHEFDRGFDLVFSVGTTSVFPYIAVPVIEAAQKGVPTVEINPAWTEVSDVVNIKLARGAADALDALWARLGETEPNDP